MSAAIPPEKYRVSRMYSSVPLRRLKDILIQLIPDTTLVGLEEQKSVQLSRLYTLNMSDGQKLLLVYAPSLSIRLMRHEMTLLRSEAILIHFINDSFREPTSSMIKSENFDQSTFVLRLMPKLLKHSSNNREINHPYSLFEQVAGEPLSAIRIGLQQADFRTAFRQLGTMTRGLASLVPPSHLFGTVIEVLPDPFITGLGGPSGSKGWKTWSEAFHSLLEGVLRDGEDMTVSLPYQLIRDAYHRWASFLDLVLIPRLAILDAASDINLMIGKDTVCEGRFVGLRSWSQGIFGDPLISNCFDGPSEDFLEGWREGGQEVVEDQENKHIRMLLYRCFRATVDIVAEYYRPTSESSERELIARRKLIGTLAELEKME